MSFNTVYADIVCPFCKTKVTSGVGFCVGAVNKRSYKKGERLSWDGAARRPEQRPAGGNLKTIGYFNCDNVECESWKDCFPDVQPALITIEDDQIVKVEVYKGPLSGEQFEIIEPAGDRTTPG